MLFGLHFTSESGESLQVAVDVATLKIFARALNRGAWGDFRRLDVQRRNDGVLDEYVRSAEYANMAGRADTISQFKVVFTGDVVGETLLGSGDATISLKFAHVDDGSITKELIAAAIRQHEERYHQNESGGGGEGGGGNGDGTGGW